MKKPFSFEDHDIINIHYVDGNLLFEKTVGKKNNKNTVSVCLKVKFEEEMLKKLYFCVYLEGKDDSVQIMWFGRDKLYKYQYGLMWWIKSRT